MNYLETNTGLRNSNSSFHRDYIELKLVSDRPHLFRHFSDPFICT